MDLARITLLIIMVGASGLLGIPIIALCDHLLAGVADEEAAPMAYATPLAPGGDSMLTATVTLPLMLTPTWRWILRGGLVVALPLALWRLVATPIYHPVNLLAAGIFMLCIATLVLIAVLDGVAHLVFIEIVAPATLLVVLISIFMGHGSWLPMLIGAMIGGLLFFGFYVLGHLLYGTDALGFGDVELAIAFGVMLGWPLLISGIIVGMLTLVGVAGMLLVLRRITTRTYMPIGAFLALGTLVTLLLVPPSWLA